MSQENVEMVLGLQPDRAADLVALFGDGDRWTQAFRAMASRFHPDFEVVFRGLLGGSHTGADGMRAGWLDWLGPWVSYRVEIEQAIDCGSRVLLLVRDFGRREGSSEEVRGNNAAIWTVRDGKVARAEFCPQRSEAFAAVGLAE
jgi:ketosteroid isomerase-like protein